jgi:hypothetical protein
MWIALGLASLGIALAAVAAFRGVTTNPGHPLGDDPRARRTPFGIW